MLAVVTLGLAVTGRIGLYLNPESSWFAVGMAVFVLVGAAASFALPLGAEAEHGHDHGDEHDRSLSDDAGGDGDEAPIVTRRGRGAAARFVSPAARSTTGGARLGTIATVTGGAIASAVVLLALVTPPASLSAELAMQRDIGAPPLFGGSDTVSLAATGDTASFGVGEWATVFATSTNPEAFDGDPVTLTGFVTPADGDGFQLTRLVITHCVIDAQPASLPIDAPPPPPETGQWVTVTGTIRASSDGTLTIDAATVEAIDEPEDPYEY